MDTAAAAATSTPQSSDFAAELDLALRTVHRASILTKQVLRSLNNSVSAQSKADASPVTVADFAAQSLIISAIHAQYPDDRFIGEESSQQLRQNPDLAASVWELVCSAAATTPRLAAPATLDEMLDVIDLGNCERAGPGRVWVLDPVDGTATFMKGQQYAVCLCLMVDGVQEVAAIGCPNLKMAGSFDIIHEDSVDPDGFGVALSAVRGQGTWIRTIHQEKLADPRRVHPPAAGTDTAQLDFVEATVGKTSLSQDEHRAVAEKLGASWPTTVLWSQQMKYVALALGATDVMVRIPKTAQRTTCLWDHAGGQLLYQEVGGILRDFSGGPIDLGQGREIRGERNFGMIGAMPWCFDEIHGAVQDVLQHRN